VIDDVFSDRLQSIVAGDEVVLARELTLELTLLLGIELGVFQQPLDVLVQVLIGELKLGDPVLVVEGDSGAVVDRLLEVVDANVVAEDLPGFLLADDERRPGKRQKGRVRESGMMAYLSSVAS